MHVILVFLSGQIFFLFAFFFFFFFFFNVPINSKSKKGRLSCLVLFYISTKYHQNIPKGTQVTEQKRSFTPTPTGSIPKTICPPPPPAIEQDQTYMTTCLSYFWSYHPLFYLKKILFLLCNSNTLWNSLMVLGRNVEQDQKMCHVQE